LDNSFSQIESRHMSDAILFSLTRVVKTKTVICQSDCLSTFCEKNNHSVNHKDLLTTQVRLISNLSVRRQRTRRQQTSQQGSGCSDFGERRGASEELQRHEEEHAATRGPPGREVHLDERSTWTRDESSLNVTCPVTVSGTRC